MNREEVLSREKSHQRTPSICSSSCCCPFCKGFCWEFMALWTPCKECPRLESAWRNSCVLYKKRRHLILSLSRVNGSEGILTKIVWKLFYVSFIGFSSSSLSGKAISSRLEKHHRMREKYSRSTCTFRVTLCVQKALLMYMSTRFEDSIDQPNDSRERMMKDHGNCTTRTWVTSWLFCFEDPQSASSSSDLNLKCNLWSSKITIKLEYIASHL